MFGFSCITGVDIPIGVYEGRIGSAVGLRLGREGDGLARTLTDGTSPVFVLQSEISVRCAGVSRVRGPVNSCLPTPSVCICLLARTDTQVGGDIIR